MEDFSETDAIWVGNCTCCQHDVGEKFSMENFQWKFLWSRFGEKYKYGEQMEDFSETDAIWVGNCTCW